VGMGAAQTARARVPFCFHRNAKKRTGCKDFHKKGGDPIRSVLTSAFPTGALGAQDRVAAPGFPYPPRSDNAGTPRSPAICRAGCRGGEDRRKGYVTVGP
jgi:hypothetical protein